MAALRDDLLEPIPGDSPAGVFLRWDSADTTYDRIKSAREEEDDLPQGDWTRERKTADFDEVIELAGAALAERSKDLQLAAWLTEALVRRDGFAGLAEGLELLNGLLDRFWEHVYPPIEEDGDAEFRVAPLVWVGERLDGSVRSAPLNRRGHSFAEYRDARALGSESDASGDAERREARQQAIAEGRLTLEEFEEAFEATPKSWYKEVAAGYETALAALAGLDATCTEKFGDDAPSFRVLREALEEVGRLVQQLLGRKLESDPDPVESEPAVVESPGEGGGAMAGAAAATSGSAPAAGSVSADPTTEAEAARCVAAGARFFRRADPSHPAPYAMLRGYRWGELLSGDTLDPKLLTAPPTDVRTRLKMLVLDSKWEELLDAAEEVMATPYGRGWLDLQRYVLTACDGLGAEYAAVGGAVRSAVASLLAERPELLEATLMDDSPTANAETLRWLRDEGLLPGDGEDGAGSAAAGPERARVRRDAGDVLDRAIQLVGAGNPQKAVEILMRAVEQDVSARAKFLHRSQITKVMVDSGMYGVARPILQELLQEIEEHGLESWEEGETVALPLGLLYRSLEALDVDEDDRRHLYQRVCRLDPLLAMEFENGGGSSAGGGAVSTEAVETEEGVAVDGDGS